MNQSSFCWFAPSRFGVFFLPTRLLEFDQTAALYQFKARVSNTAMIKQTSSLNQTSQNLDRQSSQHLEKLQQFPTHSTQTILLS